MLPYLEAQLDLARIAARLDDGVVGHNVGAELPAAPPHEVQEADGLGPLGGLGTGIGSQEGVAADSEGRVGKG